MNVHSTIGCARRAMLCLVCHGAIADGATAAAVYWEVGRLHTAHVILFGIGDTCTGKICDNWQIVGKFGCPKQLLSSRYCWAIDQLFLSETKYFISDKINYNTWC